MESRLLVVLVDPAATARSLAAQVLEEELGAYVVEAERAEELLAIVEQLVPTLIVLEVDTRRPLDLEVLRRVKTNPRLDAVPVLCLAPAGATADGAPPEGGDAWLQKPFSLDDLVDRAERLIDPPSPSRDSRRRPGGHR